MFRVAVAEGIPVSLNGADGRLFDMYGWPGDSIKRELLGLRWLEYVDVRDLKRLLRWITFGANGDTIQYRGAGPGGYECDCYLCKLNGEHLRLLTGIVTESLVMLPAPACVADDCPPPFNTLSHENRSIQTRPSRPAVRARELRQAREDNFNPVHHRRLGGVDRLRRH